MCPLRCHLRVLDRVVDMLWTHCMCPLRCHYLRVLDRMVNMFIDTLNVSSKMSLSTHVDNDILEDTSNVSINIYHTIEDT
jgi:hypothetical protein